MKAIALFTHGKVLFIVLMGCCTSVAFGFLHHPAPASSSAFPRLRTSVGNYNDDYQQRKQEKENYRQQLKKQQEELGQKIADKKKEASDRRVTRTDTQPSNDDAKSCKHYVSKEAVTFAQAHSSELVALAGPRFDGHTLGVGGLEDVIAELKRRVWTPLAAPPGVLKELGVTPVRGVLLYGCSGCGKTLLARTIGKLLSPARPLTAVSGPQLMDKFVGGSEKNLRELFDSPSPVYDPFRISGGRGMDDAALHVIVLDEFDAMARARGGGNNENAPAHAEAGVARDSVVNQILAKMDGVEPLPVPTLVIAMTNRRNLIDEALLRPGRFEVCIEVPPPATTQQRISILKVHMKAMQEAGRLQVQDAPLDGYVTQQQREESSRTYETLLHHLAELAVGFSGASLAAIPRAAASRALERAVSQYSLNLNDGKQDAIAMFNCIVTLDDLECAVHDVRRSAGSLQQAGQQQSSVENNNENKAAVSGRGAAVTNGAV